MSGPTQAFAERVQEVGRREAKRLHPGPELYRVTDVAPLKFEAMDSDLTMRGDDADVILLVREEKLDVGDFVIVLTDIAGDYYVIGRRGGSSADLPSGPAGGVLAGNYPDPSFAVDMATQGELDDVVADFAATLLGYQPLDADLTALAALTTTTFGRSLLTLADAAAARTALALVIGTDVQAHDADLDSIAALTTTSFGRGLLALADAAAGRSALGLVLDTNVPSYSGWQTWNIGWTGLTEGNGTEVAQYLQIGKTVFFRVQFQFGSTSAITGTVSIDFPVSGVLGAGAVPIGQAALVVGANRFIGEVSMTGTNAALVRVVAADQTYARAVALSSAIPGTWATGDSILLTGRYRAA